MFESTCSHWGKELTYTVCFKNKFSRNKFNFYIKKLINNEGYYVKLDYKDSELPIIEEKDDLIISYDIVYTFDDAVKMKKFIQLVRKDFKGYYG